MYGRRGQPGNEMPGALKVMSEVHDFPMVLKETISIIALDRSDLEVIMLRSVLEYFNYRVEVHWVGSRREFLEILRGGVQTFQYIILAGHGGGSDAEAFLFDFERAVTLDDLRQTVHLPGKTVLSTCCSTGRPVVAEAFLNGGCDAYIAATEDVDANAAAMFTIHLFYFFHQKRALSEAVEESRKHDAECALFTLYVKETMSDQR